MAPSNPLSGKVFLYLTQSPRRCASNVDVAAIAVGAKNENAWSTIV
jgi:hypothetical protein